MRLYALVAPVFLLACACSAAFPEAAEATRVAEKSDAEAAPPAPPPPPPPPPPTEQLTLEVKLLDVDRGGLAVLETDNSNDPLVVKGLRKPIDERKEEKGSKTADDKPKAVAASSVQSAGGALDQSRVQSAVAASMDAFRPCLSADAVVTLEALVSPLGEVLESHGVNSMPNDLRMRDCVSRAFRKVSLGETGSHDPTLFRLSLSLRLRR